LSLRRAGFPIFDFKEVVTLKVTESSVQFARINVVLSAKALNDTVISLIDAVVAGKEMSSAVGGMRTKMVRR